jgi:uncharacterized protein (TIGR02421 family)
MAPNHDSPADSGAAQQQASQQADRPLDTPSPLPPAVEFTPEPGSVRSSAPWRSRKEIIAKLSMRILEEQKAIHVLQALGWDPSVEEAFRQAKSRELPRVDGSYWARAELGFDPNTKAACFEQVARDVDRELGTSDSVARVLRFTAEQYRDVVRMLAARGTTQFYDYSRALYGSPKDPLLGGRMQVRDVGLSAYDMLTHIAANQAVSPARRDLNAEQAAEMLVHRLTGFFNGASVHVMIDPELLADATAGVDYIKVRKGAWFSRHDIDVLEVHEGWVHLATSLNGQAQPVARWLSKGAPRTVACQEGLAALMEILSGRCHVQRAQKLNDRILAVDKAEDGASFLDVYEWYRTEGYPEAECFSNTRRVFRGGVLEGGAPFTKDICYGKGLAQDWAFVQSAIDEGALERIALLFLGKISLDDIPMLQEHVASGLIRPPIHLPPMIRDLHGLTSMMAFGSLFSRLTRGPL